MKKSIEKTLEASEKLLRFASEVFGPAAAEGMGIMKDRLELARWERRNRLVDRYFEIKSERSILGKSSSPPPLFVLQILENATLEEDDDMQDIWIRLLQSLSSDRKQPRVRKAYIDVIRQLDPIDAKILETVYNTGITSWKTQTERTPTLRGRSVDYSHAKMRVTRREIASELELEEPELLSSLDNLFRLRCLSPFIEEKDFETKDDQDTVEWHTVTVDHQYEAFRLTIFGLNFIEVCVVQ